MTYITLQENWLTKGVITNLATVPGFLLMKASIANFAVWCPCHERRRVSILSANCWSSRHACYHWYYCRSATAGPRKVLGA